MSQSLKLGSYLKTTSHMVQKLAVGNTPIPSFFKFLLVGMLNTFIGMGLMLLLKNGLDWPYWYATFTGNTAGAAVSFLLNRSFTFRSQVSFKEGAPKFITVILFCYFFSFASSRLITEALEGIPLSQNFIFKDNIAILLGSVIYTITNYFGQKLFVFKVGKTGSSQLPPKC